MNGARKGDRCPYPGCPGKLTMNDGPSLVCNAAAYHRIVNLDRAQEQRSQSRRERF